MTAKRFVYPAIGSISSGTMRTEDLLDTFASELRCQMRRMRLTRDQRKRFNALLRDYCAWEAASEGDDETQGEIVRGQGDDSNILSDLFDALDEIAPPYTYFGAVEGDGACYGWWPIVDDDELPRLDSRFCVPRDQWGQDVLLVNDHGNVECGYVDRKGKFHEYWSCV